MYTANMIRTQLYIPENIHHQLTEAAKQQSKSMAELVRDFVQQGLRRNDVDRSGRATLQALRQLNVQEGPTDLSQNFDHYLYGNNL